MGLVGDLDVLGCAYNNMRTLKEKQLEQKMQYEILFYGC